MAVTDLGHITISIGIIVVSLSILLSRSEKWRTRPQWPFQIGYTLGGALILIGAIAEQAYVRYAYVLGLSVVAALVVYYYSRRAKNG